MGLILENTITEFLCALLLVFTVFYINVTKEFSYWTNRGVPHKKGYFPFGSIADIFLGRKHIGQMYNDFYKEFTKEPYFGAYEGKKPVVVLREPNLIKHILTKDFQYFVDRIEPIVGSKNDYIIGHLFNMAGKEWKKMRLKLTPTFTSGKMKSMFLLMEKCSEQLKNHVDKQVRSNPVIDVKDILARFTMDIIATCAFGLEINSLSNKDSKFYHIGTKIFTPSYFTLVRRAIFSSFPLLSKVYVLFFSVINPEITEFLTKIVRDTVKYREENKVNRNDFLDLLINIRQNNDIIEESGSNGQSYIAEQRQTTDDVGLTIEEMTAQAFVFFAAGFETSSSTMTFCLYELARHQDVQEKLYQEIKQVLTNHDGELTYQAVQEMTYMDQVVNETLRMYASVAVLQRICIKQYKMPDSELVVEKGQKVVIPVYAVHHDPKNYPDPYKFDPERFSPEKMRERHKYTHLPFGEGPRMCIGMRFGLLQTKLGLTEMIFNFKFELSNKTQIPIVFHKTSIITQPEKPILLHLSKRQ